MALKSRIFNVMQYEKHPETGEVLLTEEKIKDALAHRTIKRWAYICHDKDVYSALDEEHNPDHRKGETKGRHWHICIETGTNQIEVGVIARWLGISDNFVNVAKGSGAFLDCVAYLTHEDTKQRELGKFRYPDKEVKANFHFRQELDKRYERKLKYGKDLSDKDALRNSVLYEGMSLKEVALKHPAAYTDDMVYLKKCRLEYISKMAKMPTSRINYYIEGAGGIGKGIMSKALARALVDRESKMADDDIYFEVGANNTSFEGYDGQPVVIWNDCRAFTLLQKLGGRENVFNVFDLYPPDMRQNIKYGSVRLVNTINIVNSIQPWRDFLDGLAGEYKDKNGNVAKKEDKSQSYRRFPFFLVLHEEDFDLGINKGILAGTREFDQFIEYKRLRGNMRRIAQKCGTNKQLMKAVTDKALGSVRAKYDEVYGVLEHEQQGTDEEIMAEFADVGTMPEQQDLFDNSEVK